MPLAALPALQGLESPAAPLTRCPVEQPATCSDQLHRESFMAPRVAYSPFAGSPAGPRRLQAIERRLWASETPDVADSCQSTSCGERFPNMILSYSRSASPGHTPDAHPGRWKRIAAESFRVALRSRAARRAYLQFQNHCTAMMVCAQRGRQTLNESSIHRRTEGHINDSNNRAAINLRMPFDRLMRRKPELPRSCFFEKRRLLPEFPQIAN